MRIGMGVGISDSANKIGGRAVPWADNVYAGSINDVGQGGSKWGAYFDGPPIADVIGTNPTKISIAYWIKRQSGVGFNYRHILGSSTDATNTSKGFGIRLSSNPYQRLWVGDEENDFLTHPDYLQTNWQHFVYTWDGGTAKYYRNGSLFTDSETDWKATRGTQPSSIDTSGTQNFRIGIYGNANLPASDTNGAIADQAGFYRGHIDEVAIYTTVLSQSDVDYVYDGSTIPDLVADDAPTGLAGWWRFGDADGDDATLDTGVLKDASGNGHDMNVVDGGDGFVDFQDSNVPLSS